MQRLRHRIRLLLIAEPDGHSGRFVSFFGAIARPADRASMARAGSEIALHSVRKSDCPAVLITLSAHPRDRRLQLKAFGQRGSRFAYCGKQTMVRSEPQ